MEESKIRQSINAYSRTKQGHPYLDYGNKVKITGNEECLVMSCSLRTQYESRRVYKTIRPHLGGAVGPHTISDPKNINPWDMQLDEPTDFVKKEDEYAVKGSQWVDACSICSGKGESTCSACQGHGREICPECHGSKKERCEACDGTGFVLCPECHGEVIIHCQKCNSSGTIRYTVREQKYEYNYQTQKNELKFVDVPHTKQCDACGGRGSWRCGRCRNTTRKGYITCSACGNMGYTTCQTCKGQGELVCDSCSGRGKITCKNCKGHGQMLHGIAVEQTLDEQLQRQYLGDKRVLDLATKIQLYGTYMLKERGEDLKKNLIPSEPKCNTIINDFFDNAERNDAEILFQEAKVMRCPMHFITYTFEGETYTGIIHHDTFYPNNSPIDDFATSLVDKAEQKSRHGSSIDTLNLLDQAETVGADRKKINSLREKAEQHLDVLYKTGVDLVFWLLALFFTPVLFNFYSNINPVAPWAILANNPTWAGYKLVAVTQCIVFLLAIFLLKRALSQRDRSGHRFRSIWAYILVGMAKYLGLSFVILLILMALNYSGFSILTAFFAIIIDWLLKIILTLVVWVILLMKTLVEKIF